MELPSKYPEQRAAILKAFGTKKNVKLTNKELLELVPEHLQRDLPKVTSNMRLFEHLDTVKVGVISHYSLTDLGRSILKNLDNMRIVPLAPKKDYSRRAPAGQGKAFKKKAPEPEIAQVDISKHANSVVNSIAMLVDENASHRKLMMNVVVMITKAYGKEFVMELAESYGLTLVEEKANGDSTTDTH